MILHITRAVIIALALGSCIVWSAWSAPRFPEDEHIVSGTRVQPPPTQSEQPGNDGKAVIRGRLDDIKGRTNIGATIAIRGWATDDAKPAPVDKVEVVIDDLEVVRGVTGDARPDVVNAFNNPAWLDCGWTADVTLEYVLPGEHRIEAVAYSSGTRKVLGGVQYIEVISVR
jgi:hypothetical protein